MRILLVRPPQPDQTLGLKHIMVCEPLELEAVGAGITDSHDVAIHDMLVDSRPLEAVIESYQPNLVGTSCYINNVSEALEVCRRAKAVDPGLITVMGGVHATLNAGDFYRPEVDIIARGEGTMVFRDLVRTLETGRDLRSVQGLDLVVDGTRISTPGCPFPDNPDEIPLPDRSLTCAYRNQYYYFFWRPLDLMHTSWGCPYSCTFCYVRQLANNTYRARSLESIVTELESLEAEHVFIVDDNLFLDRRRMLRLADMIKARGIRKEYLAYTRTDFIAGNPDVIQQWADIGLCMLRVGMEAVSDNELESYDKRNTVASNARALEVCADAGVDVSASFILRPEYTAEDFRRLGRFIRDNGMVYVILNPLAPLPGTPLYDQYRGRTLVDRHDYALWDFQHCMLQPTNLSLKKFYRWMVKTYLHAYNPLRTRRLSMRRRPPGVASKALMTWARIFKIFWEMYFAHKHHEHPRPAGNPAAVGSEGTVERGI